jgi:hypothetical protein
MNIGDIVKWARFNNDPKLTEVFDETEKRLNDIGIILDIDVWEPSDLEAETIVIEVYFLKIGVVWCNPSSLEVISTINSG